MAHKTSSRKQQHVELTIRKDVGFRTKSAGFDAWEFEHDALPELNMSEVVTETAFLGKKVSFPLIISSMTGGYKEAEKINASLAEFCESNGLAIGVGSQRQAIESKQFHHTFSVVRKKAPTSPVFGNLGAPEVAALKDVGPVLKLVEMIGADGFAVHLNPLQEFLQPEGNTNFKGVLKGIEMLAAALGKPLIVKEVGAGISRGVAERLLNAGVSVIDVAGAGGTSWAGVEILRRKEANSVGDFSEIFWDWGIPTVDAVRQVASLRSSGRNFQLVASGGIHNGLDIAKALAFGADLAGAARPLLKALRAGGIHALEKLVNGWSTQFRGAMFLTGSMTIADLQQRILTRRQF